MSSVTISRTAPACLARGLVAQADQLLPGGPVPGELAVRAGGGAQDRAGVAGAEVGGVAAVERVEAGVDRIGRGQGFL